MVMARLAALANRLVKPQDLKTPQTSKVGGLNTRFNDHPSKGLTPSKLSAILEQAEDGDIAAQYQLFEDMEEKDTHIMAEMGKRRRGLLGLDWRIDPPPNATAQEKKLTEAVTGWMAELEDWDETLFDLTDAIGKGFVCQEIEWHRADGLWLPDSITHRPQAMFRIHNGYRQELRLRTNHPAGEPLQPFGWVTHVHKAKSGLIERSALFRALVWPYLFKNYSVGDLAEFLEAYGIPVRLGKYNSGASEKEKQTLLRALLSIGHRASGIIPAGMEVEFREAVKGNGQPFELMINWCDKAQSKAILGGTLTSQADGKTSTNALGNVHEEVRRDLLEGDARQVARTITRDLIWPMVVLNAPIDSYRRCPKFEFDLSEPEDIKTYAVALPRLVDVGLEIPRDWAQERLGIPKPEAGQPILARKPRGESPAGAAALRAQPSSGVPAPPVQMMPMARARVETVTNGWIEEIRGLLAQVNSLEELSELLLEIYPNLTLDEYAQVMAQALAAAHLAGRNEVTEENPDAFG